jgi:hypothetical protein
VLSEQRRRRPVDARGPDRDAHGSVLCRAVGFTGDRRTRRSRGAPVRQVADPVRLHHLGNGTPASQRVSDDLVSRCASHTTGSSARRSRRGLPRPCGGRELSGGPVGFAEAQRRGSPTARRWPPRSPPSRRACRTRRFARAIQVLRCGGRSAIALALQQLP